MNERVQRLAAKVVVTDGEKALILQPSAIDPNKAWHLPGGIRDDITEPLTQTACRELQEETGIVANETELRIVHFGEWPAHDKGEDVIVSAVFFGLYGNNLLDNVQLSDEHQNWAQPTAVELQNYRLATESRQAIEIVLKGNEYA